VLLLLAQTEEAVDVSVLWCRSPTLQEARQVNFAASRALQGFARVEQRLDIDSVVDCRHRHHFRAFKIPASWRAAATAW
jgi:hypothetical protein